MIARAVDASLMEWKAASQRGVLLVRGARQVGKTFSIRQFAKSFQSCIEVNFLETPEVGRFFQGGSLAPEPLLEKLQAYYGVSVRPGHGLLFFDEVQACPEALSSLRFFQEKLGALHVVAAGSLLEFALAEIPSFGVGRVESLFMYPLSLEEFFQALGQEPLVQAIREAGPAEPLADPLHARAVEILKTYLLTGGLPAIVQSYLEDRDINRCHALIDSLLLAYEDDFAKYKTRISPLKLRETLRASAQQAGSKFVYARINPGASVSGYDQALELLRLAGLVYKIPHSAANGLPLGAELNLKRFKVIPFDVGIYQRLLGLRVPDLLMADAVSLVNRGALAEVLCGTELVAHTPARLRPELYYWAREVRGSSAEVDYVVQQGEELVPIEVKAGTKGQMQSLYRFLAEKRRGKGVRLSLENFSRYSAPGSSAEIEVRPLYAVSRSM